MDVSMLERPHAAEIADGKSTDTCVDRYFAKIPSDFQHGLVPHGHSSQVFFKIKRNVFLDTLIPYMYLDNRQLKIDFCDDLTQISA